jgi:UDP-MurNAc hydroxylase
LWEDVAPEFADACPAVPAIRLSPGETLELPGLRRASAATARPSSDWKDYSVRRKAEWGEFYSGEEPAIPSEDLKAYFHRLQSRNDHLAKDVTKYIRVSVSGKSWGVRLGAMAEDFVIEGEDPYPPEYCLITSPRVLRAVLDGATGWEEALLSMRVRLRRIPDVFDSRFMGLLRYGNEPVQTLQMIHESGCAESIERDGLTMQRFCPHAGEDLHHAIICDGVIECPRHHWKWDAATGRCLEGGTLPLRVEPASAKAAK